MKKISYKTLICDCCGSDFLVTPLQCKYRIYNKKRKGKKIFCSSECKYKTQSRIPKREFKCLYCDTLVHRSGTQIEKSNRVFCSKSCAASFNNRNKIFGIRRSKLEIYLESQLVKLYPNLDIQFNRKDAINFELDIYIPSLNLAFELNGIFHYKSIFGSKKFEKIRKNDEEKKILCLERGITLKVIDTSEMKRFSELKGREILQDVTNLVNKLLSIPSHVEAL